MNDYDIFAKFYDTAMGERTTVIELLQKAIRENTPRAKNILELGCGTGAILKHFAKDRNVYGLDLSKGMLAVARKEIPQAKLYQQNMVNFRLKEKFDVIYSVFDSINHVLIFNDWKKIFANAHKHLSDGGIFVFDINTQSKLKEICFYPPEVHKLGDDYFILKVRDTGKGIVNWNVKFFVHEKADQYRLMQENIREISFPADRVKAALLDIFRSVTIIDTDRKRPSKHSERLYFICKK
ncbi:MAG TPA: class I SAM-dependent methyltransferase [Candidatus Kapabacteria bacterium]|nr:class I SAM-dependent methyltransferase [Candidatus Kapabacteria bacterium]